MEYRCHVIKLTWSLYIIKSIRLRNMCTNLLNWSSPTIDLTIESSLIYSLDFDTSRIFWVHPIVWQVIFHASNKEISKANLEKHNINHKQGGKII